MPGSDSILHCNMRCVSFIKVYWKQRYCAFLQAVSERLILSRCRVWCCLSVHGHLRELHWLGRYVTMPRPSRGNKVSFQELILKCGGFKIPVFPYWFRNVLWDQSKGLGKTGGTGADLFTWPRARFSRNPQILLSGNRPGFDPSLFIHFRTEHAYMPCCTTTNIWREQWREIISCTFYNTKPEEQEWSERKIFFLKARFVFYYMAPHLIQINHTGS